MSPSATSRLAVGVDLGGTNLRVALVELDDLREGRLERRTARILAEKKEPLVNRDPEFVAEQITGIIAELDRRGVVHVLGVGVGLAGMLRGWSGVVVNAPNLGWREIDFRTLLRRRLGPQVELYNDVNAIAYGEAMHGAAAGVDDILCVFLGTGIGAGLVLDGKPYIGAHHLAGEIGHLKVVPGGRPCGCGARGCVEAYASGANLAARARAELAERQDGRLVVELAGAVDRIHAGHIDEAAAAGDAYAVRLWDEVAPLYALALANATTLLNPARLVLGGGVWEKAGELRRRVLASFWQLLNAPSGEGLQVVDTMLGDQAGVIGAAALIEAGILAS